MGSPTITKLSDLVLRSHADYEAVFEHVAAHLQAEGGTIKVVDRAKGMLEASWKYGINPFGLRVTVHFTSPEEGIVERSRRCSPCLSMQPHGLFVNRRRFLRQLNQHQRGAPFTTEVSERS